MAAALPEALFTAWFNLVELCRLRSGDTLLVHGGASGVGLIAIQLGVALGATVYATAGSSNRCAVCVDAGATAAFNYREEDFVVALQSATAGRGVDVILDMAGGLYAERNLQALAADGRITHLASGMAPNYTILLSLLMQKRAQVTGGQLRPLPIARKLEIAAHLRQTVWPLLGVQIIPVLDQVFVLDQAVTAHTRMEAGLNAGKILLSL
jgi:NADPH2:quinone reductase